jgi:molecular chaperone DnaK
MIDRTTTIPSSKTQLFTTAADNQHQVEIVIAQGERPLLRANKILGRFILDGIPSAPRGLPHIEVTLALDATGILHVHAQDKKTGRKQSIKITASSGLSEDEIQRVVQEAEAHKADDERRRKLISERNRADAVVFQTQKAMQEAGEALPEAMTTELNSKIAAVQEASGGEDPDILQAATDTLLTASQQIGQYLYQKQQAEEAAQTAAETEAETEAEAETQAESEPGPGAEDEGQEEPDAAAEEEPIPAAPPEEPVVEDADFREAEEGE